MKSLLLQATSGKILSKEKCRHVGEFTPTNRRCLSSSGDETTDVELPNEGYTSGAINTDDESGSLSFCLETGADDRKDPPTPSTGQHVSADGATGGRSTPMIPGSGYSLGDYAPLSSLIPKSGNTARQKSPPESVGS